MYMQKSDKLVCLYDAQTLQGQQYVQKSELL